MRSLMKKVLILVISIAAVLSGACVHGQPTYDCSNLEHMPIDNPHFQLLWSRSGIVIRPHHSDTLMQGIVSRVFVVTGEDTEYGGSKILAFDTQSGKALWQRDVTLPASIITSDSQLYTGLYDR